jgi:hypothetical protein
MHKSFIVLFLFATARAEKILSYTFGLQECLLGRAVDDAESGVNLTFAGKPVSCVSKSFVDGTNMSGIVVNSCVDVNTLATGSTMSVFGNYSKPKNISFEFWFSLNTTFLSSQQLSYPFMEMSRHTNYSVEPKVISADAEDISVAVLYSNDPLFQFGSYSNNFLAAVGAYFYPGGLCDSQFSSTQIRFDESDLFSTLLDTIGTYTNVLYKMAIAIDADRDMPSIVYIQTSFNTSSVEYALVPTKSIFFDVEILRYVVLPNSTMRIGCTVSDPESTKAPFVIHKVSIHDELLGMNQVEALFAV